VIHATAAINGKGNESTVTMLEEIAGRLRDTSFSLLGYAFDGDSCFNSLHDGFQRAWEEQLSSGALSSFFGAQIVLPLVISDPLHLLKRIRYRLLSSDFRIGVNGDERDFLISTIQTIAQVPPAVFDNSRMTKMHDSLPLHLFSRQPILEAFERHQGREFFVLFPWHLIVAGLTHAQLSTQTRCSMFEVAFWLLYFYQKLLQNASLPPGTKEKIHGSRYATLYTRQQLRDALNTLYSLIVILRNSDSPVRLNRIGSNPLEHAFGKTRLRCRDINTMRNFISGLATEFLKLQGGNVLHLVAVAKRRTSVGVDCDPWTQSNPSCFSLDPMEIAARVFELADLPIDIVYQSTDGIGIDAYLSEIAGCLREGSGPGKPYSPIAGNRKQQVRTLSSNQLFLGVFQSPRREALLEAKSGAMQSLDLARRISFEQAEARLKRIFNRRMNLVDLRQIARIAGARVFLSPPSNAAARCDTLDWFERHWTVLEPVLAEMRDSAS
jgi:hypothetical protein